MKDEDIIVMLHDLFSEVEKDRRINAMGVYELIIEMVELVAEERGAFMQEGELE